MRFYLIVITVILIAIAYYLLGEKSKPLISLQNQVAPTASLYHRSKSVELPLIDDHKKLVDLSQIAKDKWLLLYFGYTHCPDVCPLDLAIAHKAVESMVQKNKIQVVFISVDPQRDLGNLSHYVTKFSPDFIGLTALEVPLNKLTQSLGIYHEVVKTKQRSSSNDHKHPLINHGTSYLLLNPKQQLIARLGSPHYADKMTTALDLIIANK